MERVSFKKRKKTKLLLHIMKNRYSEAIQEYDTWYRFIFALAPKVACYLRTLHADRRDNRIERSIYSVAGAYTVYHTKTLMNRCNLEQP